ncbi:hypothetical protein V2J52_00365 [Georgenia sp. MJ173]|uniref:hypothetical protein n=1 Tax=Georgenia sunbinii TaxID=3117728 RepID=UPI002F26A0C6
MAVATALMLAISALGAHAAGPDTEDARRTKTGFELVTLCLATRAGPQAERTVEVPGLAARVLLRVTRSYEGPCAEYGQSAERGEGTMTAYSQTDDDGKPVSVGVAFTAGVLDGLPYDPPTAGLWCFDKDDDGEVDPMGECAGGYEDALELGEHFQQDVDSPFTYVLTNWNPHGHMPPGVYDLPHFDVHFYMTPNAERLDIRVGPCEVLVHCDDYPLGKDLPDDKYLAPDFADLDAVEPAMGNHLVDLTGPEHHGEPFTHTFIYGVWDDEVTFYEPMVTHEWYSGLVGGDVADQCFGIKQPAAWQESGWYPTEYCMAHRENRDELTTSLEGFVYRDAS